MSIFSHVGFAAEPPPTIPPTPPPEPPPLPAEPPPLPVPTQPSHVVLDLPQQVLDRLSNPPRDPLSWFNIASSVGVGAVTAALISGAILWAVEGRRQKGETARKLLELKRQDQRQWHSELIENYVKAKSLVSELIRSGFRVQVFSADPLDDEKVVHKEYFEAADKRWQLEAIIDRMQAIGNGRTAAAFEKLREPVRDFIFAFEPTPDSRHYFIPPHKLKLADLTKLNKDGVEILAAVRESIQVSTDDDTAYGGPQHRYSGAVRQHHSPERPDSDLID